MNKNNKYLYIVHFANKKAAQQQVTQPNKKNKERKSL
jgi:hypothetical protein